MTATEASRSFSELLNRVQAGEEIEVTRNGATVAVISPPSRKRLWWTAAELKEFFSTLEPFDDEFEKDVAEARRWSGNAVFEDPWKES